MLILIVDLWSFFIDKLVFARVSARLCIYVRLDPYKFKWKVLNFITQ